MSEVSRPLKTWSHLAANRRKPTEYEIVSTNLLWSTRDPSAPWAMAPTIPLSRWLIRYRNESPLRHPDWDGYRDPNQLVYRTYTAMQDGQEAYVDGLLDDHDRNDHDVSLAPEWAATLGRLYTPSRFLIHAVQMASAYLVALAPASTIANCFAFQAGDQLRWVSRIAYRTAELAKNRPGEGFAGRERHHWESLGAWQGFRELMERLLTSWDWAEQFVALNLVAKPAIDAAFLGQLGRAARSHADTLTGFLSDAQAADSERARRFSSALVQYSLEGAPQNREVVQGWLDKWVPLGERAMERYCSDLPQGSANDSAESAKREAKAFRSTLGFDI